MKCSGCQRNEYRIDALEALVRSHLVGGDVVARRIRFRHGSIAGSDGFEWRLGLEGSDSTGVEADGDDTAEATGSMMVGGIVLTTPGSTTKTPIGGGTTRVWGLPLAPVGGTYEGATEFWAGYFDLVQQSIFIVLRRLVQIPGSDFSYSRTTGRVVFTRAPFAAGTTLPDDPALVITCLWAERELGVGG